MFFCTNTITGKDTRKLFATNVLQIDLHSTITTRIGSSNIEEIEAWLKSLLGLFPEACFEIY